MNLNGPTSNTLDLFCRAHWRPLHAAACQRGCAPVDAEDVVQDVFLSLARRGLIESLVNRPVEAQASYLFLRLRQVIINRWRDARRQCRGALEMAVSLEDENVPELPTHITPATEADRPWLAQCLSDALDRLRLQTRASLWNEIGPCLLDAERENARSGAQRVALHRARQKLRVLVREEMNGSFKDWNVVKSP
jgi:DNA-directed RNA polymerase specialized sigma24 family protein